MVSHAAEMAYLGQIHSLRVQIEAAATPAQITAAFYEAYRKEYGNTLGDIPCVIVSLKTVVQGVRNHVARKLPVPLVIAAPQAPTRKVYFKKWHDTPVYARRSLTPGMAFVGPAIVEQTDTTTVIEPGMKARIDAYGNLLAEVG